MATLHIPDFPDAAYRKLETLARSNRTTVTEEARSLLELAASEAEADIALMQEIRESREARKASLFLTDDELRRAKAWGP